MQRYFFVLFYFYSFFICYFKHFVIGNQIPLDPRSSFNILFSDPAFSNRTQESGNGFFTVYYSHTKAGNYSVEVTAEGVQLQGSPFHIQLLPGNSHYPIPSLYPPTPHLHSPPPLPLSLKYQVIFICPSPYCFF